MIRLKLAAVCHENVARSQILHQYLEVFARDAGLDIEVFSCGTGARYTYPDVQERLQQVQQRLWERGLSVHLKRNWWSAECAIRLKESDLILVAEEARRQDLFERLGEKLPRGSVFLFYEFIGEGTKDLVDTYDPNKGSQDPSKFDACFDELERIAQRVIEKIQGQQHGK